MLVFSSFVLAFHRASLAVRLVDGVARRYHTSGGVVERDAAGRMAWQVQNLPQMK